MKSLPNIINKIYLVIKTIFLCNIGKLRCSGYKVYPDGTPCFGCSDCTFNLKDRLYIYMFKMFLVEFDVIAVLGFGHFRVERKIGKQRMGIYIPWYRGFI
jgi:hypothetical protein